MDNHWVQISRRPLQHQDGRHGPRQLPQVAEFPASGAFKISVASLKNMVAKTIFAISNEESRYTLNGALLVLKAESMAMVATDGHRLAHIEKLGETLEGVSGEKKTLITRRPQRAPRPAPATPTPRPSTSPTTSRPSSSASAAAFSPAASSPASSPTTKLYYPRDNNKFVIVRSGSLMSIHPARVAQVRPTSAPDHQDPPRTERAQALQLLHRPDQHHRDPYNYDALVVGFNSQYLIDFLKAIGNTGEVRLEFKDAQSAGQMRPEDANEDVKYRYILMPMRI